MCTYVILSLGMFYYNLGNIRPIFRSSLRAIQLACLAKSSDIKEYGCDSLLKPFLEQIEQLGKVNLHYIMCGGSMHLQ